MIPPKSPIYQNSKSAVVRIIPLEHSLFSFTDVFFYIPTFEIKTLSGEYQPLLAEHIYLFLDLAGYFFLLGSLNDAIRSLVFFYVGLCHDSLILTKL